MPAHAGVWRHHDVGVRIGERGLLGYGRPRASGASRHLEFLPGATRAPGAGSRPGAGPVSAVRFGRRMRRRHEWAVRAAARRHALCLRRVFRGRTMHRRRGVRVQARVPGQRVSRFRLPRRRRLPRKLVQPHDGNVRRVFGDHRIPVPHARGRVHRRRGLHVANHGRRLLHALAHGRPLDLRFWAVRGLSQGTAPRSRSAIFRHGVKGRRCTTRCTSDREDKRARTDRECLHPGHTRSLRAGACIRDPRTGCKQAPV